MSYKGLVFNNVQYQNLFEYLLHAYIFQIGNFRISHKKWMSLCAIMEGFIGCSNHGQLAGYVSGLSQENESGCLKWGAHHKILVSNILRETILASYYNHL